MAIYECIKPFITKNANGNKCYPKVGDPIEILTRQESKTRIKAGEIRAYPDNAPDPKAAVATLKSIIKAPAKERTEKPKVDPHHIAPGTKVLLDLKEGPVEAEVVLTTAEGYVRVIREDMDGEQDVEPDLIVVVD